MIFNVIFGFFLTIMCVPIVVTQSELPCVICGYSGTSLNSNYTFSVSDVPERCDVIWYDYYFLDYPVSDADKSAISSLVLANYIVYMSISFWSNHYWSEIMNSLDNNPYCKALEDMKQFINDYQIGGIILESLYLFEGNITNYPNKLYSFISSIKADIPTLKVGILILGSKAHCYGRRDLFDFSIINSEVDFYMVDLSTAGYFVCFPNTTTRFPITTKDVGIISIEDVIHNIAVSSMDQNKLLINLVALADVKYEDYMYDMKSYSEYCSRNRSQLWCADSTQIFYDLVTYVKPYFKGIIISYLDFDDYDQCCGCGKFPVTNTYIDAWKSIPISYCDMISGN